LLLRAEYDSPEAVELLKGVSGVLEKWCVREVVC
jgi:hypothetical protein